jgi:L-glyceraldehyde 3-phosphate reductase
MAFAWLKDKRITSVLIGASSVGQLNNNIDSLQNQFYVTELEMIESTLILIQKISFMGLMFSTC